MITGSVCFGNPDGFFNILLMSSDGGELVCHPVSAIGFEGAFYTHPRLPGITEDRCYTDEERDIVVLMSGSIFNRTTLLRKTGLSGQPADPQLAAILFLREGPAFVEKLNGDFAIFILRPREKQAYLFRDQLGICPLAWTERGRTLYFSSDITALCRVFSDGRKIDSEYLLGYFKYIDYSKTPLASVSKLMPGHYLHFSPGATEIKKYWNPERIRIERKMSYESSVAELKELIKDAVRIRCDERYSAGAHVSSGIDSGVVAALARKEYSQQHDFYGLSWSPAGDFAGSFSYDERELVSKSCRDAGIQPVLSEMGETEFSDYVSRYYYNRGYFSEDEATDRASRLKINLIFSGFGGDEFISTGHSGIDLDLLRGLRLQTFFRRNSLRNPKRFIRHLLFFVINPALGILDRRTRKAFSDDARYLKKPYKKSDRNALRNFYFHRSRRQMHLNVFRFYNIPERCESWYLMGFRKGIEYRYPLLDRRIVEYMLRVPSELLCRAGNFRSLLRETGKGIIPEEVRLKESKNDPVYWSWMDQLRQNAAVRFMDEAEAWESNSDLDFVDFELLAGDIAEYRSHEGVAGGEVLFRTLVWLKGLYEFTVRYRQKG
jgi:asparagine synthase (glutamine-hydrolysing)